MIEQAETNILVVEDEPTLQFLVQRQLQALGYSNTDIAPNGLVGVEKALGKRYQLVFMDVMMPQLDGLLATQRIRQAENQLGIHTPIVGMTAFAHRSPCLDAGMDDFLQKPVMLEQLKDKVDQWLQREDFSQVMVSTTEGVVDTEPYIEIDRRLKSIEQRIGQTRKRFGLVD